jgi:Flp pilus assembly pilin Flp
MFLVKHLMGLFGRPGNCDGSSEAGASLVEYALLLLLILLVALIAIAFVGHVTANSINNSGSSLFSG